MPDTSDVKGDIEIMKLKSDVKKPEPETPKVSMGSAKKGFFKKGIPIWLIGLLLAVFAGAFLLWVAFKGDKKTDDASAAISEAGDEAPPTDGDNKKPPVKDDSASASGTTCCEDINVEVKTKCPNKRMTSEGDGCAPELAALNAKYTAQGFKVRFIVEPGRDYSNSGSPRISTVIICEDGRTVKNKRDCKKEKVIVKGDDNNKPPDEAPPPPSGGGNIDYGSLLLGNTTNVER